MASASPAMTTQRRQRAANVARATRLTLAAAFALHTWTAVVPASGFGIGFWLWSIAPYAVAVVLYAIRRFPYAALGAALLPALTDLAMYIAVFQFPRGSTAALGLFAMPLWNLVVIAPLGGLLGWLRDRRAARSTQTTGTGRSSP